MKKILASILLLAVVALGADFTMTITIPEAKITSYRIKFLAIHPNSETKCEETVEELSAGAECTFIPKYTDGQWLKEWTVRQLKYQAKRGEKLLHEQSITNDDYGVE